MAEFEINEPFRTKYSNYPGGVVLLCGRYVYDNTQKYISIQDILTREPIATASVMLDGIPQEPSQIYIKNWSENEGILEELIRHRIIKRPSMSLPTGFVEAQVCELLIPIDLFGKIPASHPSR